MSWHGDIDFHNLARGWICASINAIWNCWVQWSPAIITLLYICLIARSLVLPTRGVRIWVPHNTIRISIQRSWYNTYLDTYLNAVTSQRDVMSSMKAEMSVIRSTAHNLLLQWIEYLLLQLLLVEPRRDFAELYQGISINLIRKRMCFN